MAEEISGTGEQPTDSPDTGNNVEEGGAGNQGDDAEELDCDGKKSVALMRSVVLVKLDRLKSPDRGENDDEQGDKGLNGEVRQTSLRIMKGLQQNQQKAPE